MLSILRWISPVHLAKSALCNVPLRRSLSVSSLRLPEYDEPLTCFACVVYRPRRTLMQSLLENVFTPSGEGRQ